jgi:hypothetical protein
MRSQKLVHLVSCHAEGEVGNVIVGGVSPPPGETLWQQARWIAEDQELRRFVLNEPRGGVFKHVNLLVPAKHPDAAFGFIVMEPEHTPPMSGSNSICVATVLLDSGLVAMREPVTEFILEAPGGLVPVKAYCENRSIEIHNVASFADRLDANLEVPGVGTLRVDTAYGGDSFVIVDASELGFAIRPDEAGDLARMGASITRAANEQLGFSHPDNPDWADRGKRGQGQPQYGGYRSGETRPLTLRHRLLGAHGEPAGQGVNAGRRTADRQIDYRLALRLQYRQRYQGWRKRRDNPFGSGARLDNRNPPDYARPGRSVARRLPPERYLAIEKLTPGGVDLANFSRYRRPAPF